MNEIDQKVQEKIDVKQSVNFDSFPNFTKFVYNSKFPKNRNYFEKC